jgi:hypothetical protein
MSLFWLNLLQQVLMIIVPALVCVALVWLSAFAAKEWKAVLAKYPQITTWEDTLKQFAPVFVAAAEQMRKAGLLPSGAEAKAWVIKYLQNYLNSKGFSGIDVGLIEATTEADVAKIPSVPMLPATITVPPSTTPTVVSVVPPAPVNLVVAPATSVTTTPPPASMVPPVNAIGDTLAPTP